MKSKSVTVESRVTSPSQSDGALTPPRQSNGALTPPRQSNGALTPPRQSNRALTPSRQSRTGSWAQQVLDANPVARSLDCRVLRLACEWRLDWCGGQQRLGQPFNKWLFRRGRSPQIMTYICDWFRFHINLRDWFHRISEEANVKQMVKGEKNWTKRSSRLHCTNTGIAHGNQSPFLRKPARVIISPKLPKLYFTEHMQCDLWTLKRNSAETRIHQSKWTRHSRWSYESRAFNGKRTVRKLVTARTHQWSKWWWSTVICGKEKPNHLAHFLSGWQIA